MSAEARLFELIDEAGDPVHAMLLQNPHKLIGDGAGIATCDGVSDHAGNSVEQAHGILRILKNQRISPWYPTTHARHHDNSCCVSNVDV
jgi:hypothetical protein